MELGRRPARRLRRWALGKVEQALRPLRHGLSTNSPSGSRSAAPPAASKAASTLRAKDRSSLDGVKNVQDRQLPGVDGGLAEEPEDVRVAGLLAQPGVVIELWIDTVDGRCEAGSAGDDHQV
jgi:hypothetical protein